MLPYEQTAPDLTPCRHSMCVALQEQGAPQRQDELQAVAETVTSGVPCRSASARSVLAAILIHTAADGLAVGVAHMSTSIRLAVAIGVAMVLHKGPVAFGLMSFLIAQGCSMAAIWQVCVGACAQRN